MGRGLDGFIYVVPVSVWLNCAVLKGRRDASTDKFPAAMAAGKHLFPFRTEKLSPLSADGTRSSQAPGRVGRRRLYFDERPSADAGGLSSLFARRGRRPSGREPWRMRAA